MFEKPFRVLIVDDQEANIRLLERILRRDGYGRIVSTCDPREAVPLFESSAPDIILLDLHMPHVDGFQIMEELRPRLELLPFLPILVLTADATAATKRRALMSGAKDFLVKPFDPTEVLLRIRNLLETRRLHLMLHGENRALEQRMWERTLELEQAQAEMLERLAQAAEFHDDDTGLHTRRVGELSAALASVLGLPEDEAELIRRTAPLHDVGKIGIPDTLLLKPGRFSPEERKQMERHTLIGARILTGGRSDPMRMAEQIALAHHERWDGTGYPQGLAGTEIPLPARIVAVADVFDALTHDRPYRAALPTEHVVGEIRTLSGTHFDPDVVAAFLEAQAKLRSKSSKDA